MKISEFAVNRPKLTAMAVLIVIIIGGVSLRRLPLDLMPDISFPTLSISSSYQHASPEEVEELITRPLEEAMSAVPGVEEISSSSSEGRSAVRVSFGWGTDLDAAANDVRDRLDRVIPRLPENADRPVLRKFDPAAMPILILGASSDMDPLVLRRVIDDQVKHRVERVPGVAALDIRGGLEREIQVNIFPDKIRALGIPVERVLASVRAGNITLPAGSIERGVYDVILRTPGEYSGLEELRRLVVDKVEGVPVRLEDIASVEDSARRVTRTVRVNGRPGVHLTVMKQSGTNTVDVAGRVLREIERINRDIPRMEIIPIMNSSDYIRRSISSVGNSALYGGLFAVIILLFFLRSISSTAIISAAIPTSIIASFTLMYFSGFTLNIMTLGGMALGIGMLVDNAIVVLENIYRKREGGLSAKPAAVEGSGEVAGAVIASTLTTVVIFLPLVFMEGMAGVMFKQLALVVGFALLCSLAVSLTVVPMLASKHLNPVNPAYFSGEGLGHKMFRLSGRMFSGLEDFYKRFLGGALARRGVVLASVSVLFAGSLAIIPMVGVELMPQSDEGEVRVIGEMETGTRLTVIDESFRAVEEIVSGRVPEAKSSVTVVGGGFGPMSSGASSGQLRVSLVPRRERTRSSEQIASDLRRELTGIPGMIVRTRAAGGMFMRGMGSADERLQVEIRGHDLDTADILAARVKSVLERVEGITDAQISRERGSPEKLIIVDRDKAADMNLTVMSISQMLQTALGGASAGYFREGGSEYRILVRLKDADKMDVEEVLNLPVSNPSGGSLVLGNFVDIRPHSGPVRIDRKDQERIVNVSANITGRDMGSIIASAADELRAVSLPEGFTVGFAGEFEQQQEAFSELAGVFLLAVILVYMVLVALYESFRDPFVVMFTVPLALIGVIWMLFLSGTTFNMQSFIGCIMLGGIVVNNSIVLVDYVNLLRRRDGMSVCDAVAEAGRRRLRPILMTSFTTILALVPMALGLGEGGEFQAPLARAVIGGLMVSSLITLCVIPVIYCLFEGGRPASGLHRFIKEKPKC